MRCHPTRSEEARRLYSRALESLDRLGPLTPSQLTVRAQCLAHLDRMTEAVEIIAQALRENGDDPEVLVKAALIYALAGNHASALAYAEAALKKGVNPRQFTSPNFGSLSYDPKIQALLDRANRPR